MRYRVYIEKRVSTVVYIDADTPEDAVNLVPDHEPGAIVTGAFGGTDVDEAGEWEVLIVTDENGQDVWHG